MNPTPLTHLLSLAHLPRAAIERLLDRAEVLREQSQGGARALNFLAGRTIIHLFFESSTRTRVSFELAARRLGATVVNFDISTSSTLKGESLLDTVHTLEAMHCDALVVRHSSAGTAQTIAEHLHSDCAVINAGDGHHAHPTQGLLDALTIRQHHRDLSKLKIVICGDIRHSRVARSDIQVLQALGVGELRVCAPHGLMPDEEELKGCRIFHDFDEALMDVDVAIQLRLQKERMAVALIPSEAEYFRQYGLNSKRLARAKPNCLVMHPGPINRGIEIASDVADSPQSCILEQVTNGVFVRMAVLAELLVK